MRTHPNPELTQSAAQFVDTDGWLVFFGGLGLAQDKQIFDIFKVFLQAVEFFNGQDGKFGFAVTGQKFGVKFDYGSVSLAISFAAVYDSINDNGRFNDFKEDAIISHA